MTAKSDQEHKQHQAAQTKVGSSPSLMNKVMMACILLTDQA